MISRISHFRHNSPERKCDNRVSQYLLSFAPPLTRLPHRSSPAKSQPPSPDAVVAQLTAMDAPAIAARCLPRHVHLLSRAYEGCALLNSSRFLLQVRARFGAGFDSICVMFCVHFRHCCGCDWEFIFWFALAHACVMAAPLTHHSCFDRHSIILCYIAHA
jgi:hypothetical protein